MQGIEQTATDGGTKGQNKILKINGNYFCYEKQKSYRELLYDGQIIKQNENCKYGYKNCGTIDTLKQKLCILIENECPLYDVGIKGGNENYESDPKYIYESSSKIYYNSNNYENENKKIIGNLILNEGEPCYNPKEKLWRTFGAKETKENHLKCELEIFGKNSDNRYDKKGDITYYDLYKDNFNYQFFSLLDKNELKKEKVSLYKREFLGIDKDCDEKSDLTEKRYKKLKKNQKSEKILLLVEPIIIFAFEFTTLLIFLKVREKFWEILQCINMINFISFISFMICQSVFIRVMIENDLFYECSDEITKEIINQETKNTKKTIIYATINLAADCIIIILLLAYFCSLRESKCCCCDCSVSDKELKPILEPKKRSETIKNIDEEPEYNNPKSLKLKENINVDNEISGSKPETQNLDKINPTLKIV